MQLFDVFTKRIYEKDGEKKAKYYKAGTMKITDRDNIYLRLFHNPNTDFFIRGKEQNIPVVDIEQ